MNETAKQYRKQEIEAEKQSRKELTKEFFELKEQILERLEQLLKTGIDDEDWICLNGIEIDLEKKEYKKVCGTDVIKFKKILEDLKEVDYLDKIPRIEIEEWSAYIDGVIEMTELWNEFMMTL